jgi:hypothetical protein
MKLTGNGQTWYLRSRLVDYFDESFGDPRPVYLPDRYQNYYMAGDECELTQGVQGSGTSNLCGGLTSANPCSLFGERIEPWEWPYEPYIYTPYTSTIGYRQSVRWQVSDDCSEVTLTLYYTVRTGASVPFTFTTYRYTTTLATQWIGSGLPVVFETEFGDLTLAECGASEPPPPIYVLCCWQAAITTPAGTDTYVSQRAADIAICIEGQPRDDGQITEQCSSEIRIDYVAETEENATGVANYSLSYVPAIIRYEVSPDYSYVRITIEADSDDGLYHWESVEVDVPFTSDWFLTPVEVTATSANGELDPADATITLSVCGYEVGGDPCWGDKLVCVDLEYDVEPEFNGTYSMTWDGSQYVSEWSEYKTNYRVRVRLVESEETPGTWETWIDVEFIDTELIESLLVSSEIIECDPDGTPTGGGASEVDEWPVTVTIHECATECLQQTDQMFFTIDGLVGQLFTPGTYAISQTGTGYQSSWTPIIEGGGGYQIRVRIEWDGVSYCAEPFETLANYGAYVDLYDVDTEETTTGLLYNFCVDCSTPTCHGCVPIMEDWPLLITEGLPTEVTIFA